MEPPSIWVSFGAVGPNEYLAGYPGASKGIETKTSLEASPGLEGGWRLFTRVGKNATGFGGGGMGTGEPVTVGYVDEEYPQVAKKYPEPLVQRLRASVIVTDDLASYKQVTDALQLEHQICQFHVRFWVDAAMHELKESFPAEWIEVAEEVHQILRDLPIKVISAWWHHSIIFHPVNGDK